MTETKIKVRTTLGVTDHNLLDNRFIDNQHTINAISGLEEALESKQNVLAAGENIEISEEGEISAVDTTYTAGENIEISEENVISANVPEYTAGTNVSIDNGVISAVDTTYSAGTNVSIDNGVISANVPEYTAGTNVSIDNGVISAVDTTYSAGVGIDITNGVISNTQTSAEWGNVTGNLDDQTDLKNALDAKANSSDLATVATSGSYADLSNKPTIADGILTIQKNGTTVDTFTANSSDNKTVNLVIPTTAADVSAMPDSVKYGALITVTIDSSNYQVTTTLKDQDGNTLGTAQVIDLPLESVVVSGSYDDVNKNVVLTLQNGSTITFSVADLVSGLQSEITSQNKLDADLVDDSTSINKFVTASDKTTWNAKQDAISDLATIRAGANAGATAVQAGDLATVATSGLYSDLSGTPSLATVATSGSYTDLTDTPTIPTVIPADNSTIVENVSHQLQTVGVVNQNTESGAVSPLKLWNGTQQEWEEGVSQTWYNWENPNGGFSSDEYTSLPSTNIWSYVAYGNNRFVAVPGLAYPYVDNVAYSADDGETWTSSSLPTGHNTRWNVLAFGSNNFVTMGYNSNAATYSSDGSTWTDVTLPATERWTGIAYGGGRFVAVSSQMVVDTSVVYSTNDGISWTANASKFNWGNTMCSLVYGDNMFLAIGGINTASDKTAYSTDGGETWTEGTMSSSQTWMRAAYGNGKFVAVAKGTDTYAYSSDGLTWTESTLPSSANWMSITFGNSYFVAVADNGKYAYSPDGENWEEDTFTGTNWYDIAFGNNKYVAITKDTYITAQLINELTNCYTSEANPTTTSTVYSAPNTASALTITSTGEGSITLSDTNTYNYTPSGNQTTTQSIAEAYPNYLCNINGVGVKIGSNNIANLTAYSDFTGATSSVAGSSGLVPAPTTNDVDNFLKGDGTWATLSVGTIANKNTAVGATTPLSIWQGTQSQWEQGSSQTWYNWANQSSGLSWVSATSGTSEDFKDVAYGDGNFIAVTDGDGIYKSTDGRSWSKVSSVSNRFYRIGYGDGKFVAVGRNGTLYTSSNGGDTWTQITGFSGTFYGVAYGNDKFVITGENYAYYSTDAATWNQATGYTSYILGVEYCNGQFIGVGNGEVIITSSDGTSWTSVNTGLSTSKNDIAYGNGVYVAVGSSGFIMSSTDATNWTQQSSGYSNELYEIIFENGKFSAVSTYGDVYSSSDGENWTYQKSSAANDLSGIAYGMGKYVVVGRRGYISEGEFSSVYTLDETPTTSSVVYSSPSTTSALTITAVGTGTITLSDTNTYTYMPSANQLIYQSVGDIHPDYLCNINGVGLKIGTTDIANISTTYSPFQGATSSEDGSTGLVPAPSTSDRTKYLKGDGTWAELDALKNTATAGGSLSIEGNATSSYNSINMAYRSLCTGNQSIAIGTGADVRSSYATALGYQAASVGNYTVTLGNDAFTNQYYDIAIGSYAYTYGNNNIAIGYKAKILAGNSESTEVIQISVAPNGTSVSDTSKAMYVGFSTGNYKLLDGTTGKIPSERLDASSIVENKNTASGATNPLSIWQGTQEEWNVGGGVKDTYYGWDRGVSSTSTVNSVSNSSYGIGSLAYGNEVMIAVSQSSYTNSKGAWKSTDNGNTWTKITFIDEYVYPNSIFFVNGEFILHDSRYIIRSTDGINWTYTAKPSDTPYQFRFLVYGNGVYIGTTNYDKNIYRSTDGINYQVVQTNSDYVSVSYGNGLFLYIKLGGTTTQVGYSTNGSDWSTTSIDNGSYCPICYDGSKFLTCTYNGYIATSTDGITWTTVKRESLLTSCEQLWYLGGKFVCVKTYNTSIVYSYDGINWKKSNATITNGAYRNTLVYDDVADLYVSLSGQNTTADIFSFDSYYTLDEVPTTSSQVYTAPDVTSTLTITSVDTANNTITLSDANTYNEGGNAYSYYTVAEAHPNYLCFINNVGIKMGNVSFTPVVDQTYNASSTNAQSGVAVASGIADALGTIETALQGV